MFPILYSRQFFFALFSFFIFLHIRDARADLQNERPLEQWCSSTYYILGSQYQSNLNLLLGYLVSNGTQDGFYFASVGAGPDTVYGLAQCRDDLSKEICGNCLRNVSTEVIQICPNQRRGIIRRVYCLLRYSDVNFFSVQVQHWESFTTNWNVSDADFIIFDQKLGILLKNLSSLAAKKLTRYESGNIGYTALNDIYGMVQCTRDLSTTDCFACLQIMYSSIQRCCDRRAGAQLFGPSCYIRYEASPFLQEQSQSPPPPFPLQTTTSAPLLSNNETTANDLNGTGGGKSTNVIVIIVPIIASVVLIAICAFFISRRIQKKARKAKPEINSSADVKSDEDDIKSEESLQFDLNTIRASTSNFSDENKIGQGGFGAVYKGELHDGREIAVKRLSKDSGQGSREFKNEVVLLHKLQHRNLVRLLGYCLGEEEKLLIYEYIPNLSLDKYIFDSTKKSFLDWKKRYNIIGGIARGLLYLHEDSRLRIIHRDLKCGNILLDEAMDAKIADFGMAKLFGVDQTQGNTSKIAGTFGYMAPEYIYHGLYSIKSDVYSFGILLLEIVTGESTSNFNHLGSSLSLVGYAWKLWKEGNASQLFDSTIIDNVRANEATRCIHIALLCVQENLDARPTMSSVVLMLNSYSITLEFPSAPAFTLKSMTPEHDTISLLYSSDGTTFPRQGNK